MLSKTKKIIVNIIVGVYLYRCFVNLPLNNILPVYNDHTSDIPASIATLVSIFNDIKRVHVWDMYCSVEIKWTAELMFHFKRRMTVLSN